ncbi:MAG: hypothetical protein AB8B64_23370 [Granulosicoccus sp.]
MDYAKDSIEAVPVDFDGVLRHWPSVVELNEDTFGLPCGAIMRVAFADSQLQPAIRGLLTDEQWRALIVEELYRQYPQSEAKRAVMRWSESVGGLDLDVLHVLKVFSKNMKLILATNATSRLQADLEKLGIAKLFNGVANSSALRFIKSESSF